MSRTALSNTGDWKLSHDEQDVRGFRALDKDGTEVGIVDTMIVNTDERRVDALVLEDGTEYPARDASIGDGVVYLTTLEAEPEVAGTVTVFGDDGHVVERERVENADYDAHADAFRTHLASSYGADAVYEDYEPAYRYGYESAHADDFRNRSFVDAEDDLLAGHSAQYAERDYDADRSAVRYGYTRAQHPSR